MVRIKKILEKLLKYKKDSTKLWKKILINFPKLKKDALKVCKSKRNFQKNC